MDDGVATDHHRKKTPMRKIMPDPAFSAKSSVNRQLLAFSAEVDARRETGTSVAERR